MKRLHLHVGVTELAQSVRFYSTLFASQPTVLKDDYAKWMLDDPRVNFAISSGKSGKAGVEHLGIQAESDEELNDIYGRLMAAERPMLEEGETTCCYAKSTKSWISDPDGVVWEAFHTHGETTVYGNAPTLGVLAEESSAADGACCNAETPQGVCCPPKAELPADAPCCGGN